MYCSNPRLNQKTKILAGVFYFTRVQRKYELRCKQDKQGIGGVAAKNKEQTQKRKYNIRLLKSLKLLRAVTFSYCNSGPQED